MPDDAVDSLVRKYGKKEDAVSDPVDSLVAKYGAPTDTTTAVAPKPKNWWGDGPEPTPWSRSTTAGIGEDNAPSGLTGATIDTPENENLRSALKEADRRSLEDSYARSHATIGPADPAALEGHRKQMETEREFYRDKPFKEKVGTAVVAAGSSALAGADKFIGTFAQGAQNLAHKAAPEIIPHGATEDQGRIASEVFGGAGGVDNWRKEMSEKDPTFKAVNDAGMPLAEMFGDVAARLTAGKWLGVAGGNARFMAGTAATNLGDEDFGYAKDRDAAVFLAFNNAAAKFLPELSPVFRNQAANTGASAYLATLADDAVHGRQTDHKSALGASIAFMLHGAMSGHGEAPTKEATAKAVNEAVASGQVSPKEAFSPERVAVAEDAIRRGDDPVAAVEATPPEVRPDGSVASKAGLPTENAIEDGLIDPKAVPLVRDMNRRGVETVSSGVGEDGKPLAIGIDKGGETVIERGEPRPIRENIGAVGEQPAKAKGFGGRVSDFWDAFNQRMFQRHMRVAPEAGQEAVSAVDARIYAETMTKIQGDREAAHLREGGVPEEVYSDVLDVRNVRHTKEVFEERARSEAERVAAAEREAADIKQAVADERDARVDDIENRVKRNAALSRDVVASTAKQMREVKDYASQKHREEVNAVKKRIQFEKQQASEHPEDAKAQEYAEAKIAEHEAAIKDAAVKLRETIRWANGQQREAAKFADDTRFSNQSEEIRGKARAERDAREALRHRKMEVGPDGKRIVTRRALKEVVADMMDAKVKAQRHAEAASAVRGDQVGKPGSSFKTEADYEAALNHPAVQKAIESRRKFINTRTTPDYLAATDADPRHQFPVDPVLGFHQSMNPLTEEQFTESKSKRLRTDEGVVPGGGTKEARKSGGSSGPMKMFRRAPRTAQHRTGTSHAYETDFRANLGNQIASARESGAKARYDKALVARGLASWEPGRIDDSVAIPVKRFGGENATMYVKRELAAEALKVHNADYRADDIGSALSGAFTKANVAINPGEMTTHLKNQFKAVVGSESDIGLPTYVERLANVGAFPVTALVKVGRALKMMRNPPVERIERLSELGGVLRGRHGDPTMANKGGNALIEAHNRIAVYLDAVYDQKVKRGADPSPDARRTFINERLGNYLSGSHGKPFQFLRTYSSPFLVAKTTQASMGLKQLTTGHGLSNLAGVAVATYVMSWVLTGKEPPKDAPIGSVPWKTSDGKTHYIDLVNFTPAGRLVRSGVGAIVEGKRAGLSNNAVAGDAAVAASRQVEDAFMGPWTQFLEETFTGKDYAGQPTNKANPKHPDGVQLAMNAIYALADTNPLAGVAFHAAVGDSEKAHEAYERFSPVKEGKGEKYVENLPQIRRSQEIKAFEEDAFRRMARAKETHDADEIARVRKAIKAEADALKKKFAK